MGTALNKPARLLPVPSWLLQTGATALGRRALAQRLCGSLQVDIGKTRELLGWTPPSSVDQALSKTGKHFLERQTK
jgi:UDP-glucose 4-epimerase